MIIVRVYMYVFGPWVGQYAFHIDTHAHGLDLISAGFLDLDLGA